jgi:hypothetical protein
MEAKRKDPTVCNSVIEIHKAKSFRVPDSFKMMPMGSPHSPAAFHRQQLTSIARTSTLLPASWCATPCMWLVTSNSRISERASPSAKERTSERDLPLVVEDWESSVSGHRTGAG